MMTELRVEADTGNLKDVLKFIEDILENNNVPMKIQTKLAIAAEEIFVNIASYAYTPGKGDAVIRCEMREDPKAVEITFIDWGVPYDPLAKDDPDTTLSAEDREIGGLGIFMVKNFMDDMQYEYTEGQNRLKICKKL